MSCRLTRACWRTGCQTWLAAMLEWQVRRLRADISLEHRVWRKANSDSTGRARRRYNRPRSVSRLESMTLGRTHRGPRSINAKRSGPPEDRAREPPILSGRGALTHRDGGGTWIHAMDTEGARRWSHEPTVVRLELGFGWPESAHRWTGTTCRAASLDSSGWSEERDRMEGGDLRRTGPSRTTIQDVPLCIGNATSDGNGTIDRTRPRPVSPRPPLPTVTELGRRGLGGSGRPARCSLRLPVSLATARRSPEGGRLRRSRPCPST